MRRVACDPGRRLPAPRYSLSIHYLSTLSITYLPAEFASSHKEDSLVARTPHVSLPPESAHLPWSTPLSFGKLHRASPRVVTTRGAPSLAPMPRRNTADVQVSPCQQLVLTITCWPLAHTMDFRSASSFQYAPRSSLAPCEGNRMSTSVHTLSLLPCALPTAAVPRPRRTLREPRPPPTLEPRYVTLPVVPSLPLTPHCLPYRAAPLAPSTHQIHSRSSRGCVPSKRSHDDSSSGASLSRPQAGEYYQITPGREWRARRPNPAFPRSGPSTDPAFLFVHPGLSPLDGSHLVSLVMASGHREYTRVSTAGPNFDHPIPEGDLPDWALNAFDEFAADTLESEAAPDISDPGDLIQTAQNPQL